MRIIAGTARSMPLKTIEGKDTRPTTDRIKETLFNIIQMDVPGSVFLDLFAGSGGIGLEAVSRYVFDIIFMDPPYGLGLEYDVLLHLKDSSILTEDTLIIVEESLDTDPYEMEKYGFEITRIKRYKTNQHVFLKRIQ